VLSPCGSRVAGVNTTHSLHILGFGIFICTILYPLVLNKYTNSLALHPVIFKIRRTGAVAPTSNRQPVSLCVSHCLLDPATEPRKDAAIVFGSRQRFPIGELPHGVDTCGTTIAFSDAIKLLVVTLDSTLSLDRQATNIARGLDYHI